VSQEIHLVTGNPNKLRELRQVFPAELGLGVIKLDITEIQPDFTSDVPPAHQVVGHKLDEAYSKLGMPVIVEDISAELGCLNGLPGPYIKAHEQVLGRDALWHLAEPYEDRSVHISATMGYFDGTRREIVDGVLEGTVVAPRGTVGWGFDFVVVPTGETQTLAELGSEVKNRISHRYKAAQAMASVLFGKQ